MGSFYTNYTLRYTTLQTAASVLAGRSAILSPAQNDCIVVYDQQSDEQDQEVIGALASKLSRECGCPVLAVLNHDDDILWYQLYLDGELADTYDSSPGYFDAEAEPSEPIGGDARRLCEAFGVTDVAGVESILRKSSFDEDGYVFAVDRHSDLARALHIPSFGVGFGYDYIADGELPDGLEESDLRTIT